jgi:hypothetical protein
MLLSIFSKVEPLTSSLSYSSVRRRRNPAPSQIWPLGRPEATTDFLFFLQLQRGSAVIVSLLL